MLKFFKKIFFESKRVKNKIIFLSNSAIATYFILIVAIIFYFRPQTLIYIIGFFNDFIYSYWILILVILICAYFLIKYYNDKQIATLIIAICGIALATLFSIESNNSTKHALEISNNLAFTSAESLRLAKEEFEKVNDPFFNFVYNENESEFIINAPEDVKIEYVEWYFQNIINDFGFSEDSIENRFIKIKESSAKLGKTKILNYLINQLISVNKNLTPQEAEYYIKCSYQSDISNSLSVIVTIGFNKRGKSKNERVDKYLYIENAFSANPQIIVLNNINKPEISKQFYNFEQFKIFLERSKGINWSKITKEEINLVNKDAKICGVIENSFGKIRYEEYRSR